MIRAEIIVEGEVQKVGYRDFVQNVARSLRVKGFVENLKDGAVRIVCEADEEVLKNFIKEIEVKREFINVKKIKIVGTFPATGEFEYFEIKYGPLEEELGERMGTAIRYAGAIWQDIKEMHKDLKAETTGIKESIKEMHKGLKAEIIGTREEIKESIKEMHKGLKAETTGIKESIKEMNTDVNKSFEEMSKRYDSISAELIRTREELTRAVDRLSNLINEFIKRGAKD